MKKVVAFEIKSKMSDIAGKVGKLKKRMWENDRKSHNKLTKIFKEFHQEIREKTRYFIMMDPEVSPERADGICKEILNYIDRMNDALGEDHSYKEELKNLKIETDALIVLIALDEHETSFFA